MTNNKYIIKYTNTFMNQFSNILKYFVHNLQNKIVAENFYNEVITEIEKRSKNPEGFEIYKSKRKRKNKYYRIYVKNYIVFYVVKGDTMEIRRIIYSKRNYNNYI